jgi:nondiscriminating glutamyl-tRNA synthetase
VAAVRVRFAPSPTGALHLGSALTGVANFLFARHAGGSIVLRIDDTDATRSDRRFERGIRQDAEWLGLRFDEGPEEGGPYGPYRQSERMPLYREHADRLLASGGAVLQGDPPAVVFRVPATDVVVRDAARGDVIVRAGAVQDFVILRSDRTATYTLATAVDDALMEITHVIRGEDHLTNTARQLLLMDALGLRQPRYAHTALLVGEDGAKLSKRTGAPSIAELRGEGYPPEALLNYFAQLACPALGDEPMLLGQLAARFELGSLSRGASRFDRGRIDWLSQEHLKRLNVLELARRVGQVLEQRGVSGHPAQLTALAPALRGVHTLLEAADDAEAVLVPPRRRPELDATGESVAAAFAEIRGEWPEVFVSTEEAEEVLAELVARLADDGVPARAVKRALRRALTGRDRGIALPHVIAAIERDDAVRRAASASGAPA